MDYNLLTLSYLKDDIAIISDTLALVTCLVFCYRPVLTRAINTDMMLRSVFQLILAIACAVHIIIATLIFTNQKIQDRGLATIQVCSQPTYPHQTNILLIEFSFKMGLLMKRCLQPFPSERHLLAWDLQAIPNATALVLSSASLKTHLN